MLYLIFLSSGLFLGWSLGANDASNVFGTAVGSRMVSFRKAAWIASIFVILGSVIQGHGTANTLTTLGAVNALGGAFTVALCAAITVIWMTKVGLPVSTSQAIVGAIIGWTLFAGKQPNMDVLLKIVTTWVSSPFLGMIFSILIFLGVRRLINKSHIHIVKLDVLVRWGLILVGAFGAYSLGANNVANVLGVFIPTAPNMLLSFGTFTLTGEQILFLLGGVAIATGIFTYSKRVMQTVGNGIMALTPETALVVVLAQAIVLFIFSSTTLSNFFVSVGLPPIPLVPISSTQVVIGAILGIGIIKGGSELNFKMLGNIALGWVITPLAAGILSFVTLFFTQNIFQIMVVEDPTAKAHEPTHIPTENQIVYDLSTPALYLLIFALLLLVLFLVFYQQKLRLKAENMLLVEQKQTIESIKALNELELQNTQRQNTYLANSLEIKKHELNTLVKNLIKRRSELECIVEEMSQLVGSPDIQKRDEKLKELINALKQLMLFSEDLAEIYRHLEEAHKGFKQTLAVTFPALTEVELQIALLLRLNFSVREIAVVTNNTIAETENIILTIKNKLALNSEESLTIYLSKL